MAVFAIQVDEELAKAAIVCRLQSVSLGLCPRAILIAKCQRTRVHEQPTWKSCSPLNCERSSPWCGLLFRLNLGALYDKSRASRLQRQQPPADADGSHYEIAEQVRRGCRTPLEDSVSPYGGPQRTLRAIPYNPVPQTCHVTSPLLSPPLPPSRRLVAALLLKAM